MVTYSAYSEIWSLRVTYPLGAVGSYNVEPWGLPPDLSQYLGQGF